METEILRHLEAFEQPDGIPSVDERTYTGGTLIVEEATSRPDIRHHGTGHFEVRQPDVEFRGLLDAEVACVSG